MSFLLLSTSPYWAYCIAHIIFKFKYRLSQKAMYLELCTLEESVKLISWVFLVIILILNYLQLLMKMWNNGFHWDRH